MCNKGRFFHAMSYNIVTLIMYYYVVIFLEWSDMILFMKSRFRLLMSFALMAVFFITACSGSTTEESIGTVEELELFETGIGILAFAAQPEGGDAYDIFMLDLPSGDVTRITEDLSADISPALPQEGGWLIFSSDRGGDIRSL